MKFDQRTKHREVPETQLPMTKAVNKAIIRRWVNALKAATYRGKGNRKVAVMCDMESGCTTYSALGVLCDITEPRGWKWNDGYLWHDEYLTKPNPEFLLRHGLTESIAMLVDRLNEEGGKSLGFVANYLRSRYLGCYKKSYRTRKLGKVVNRIQGRMILTK